MFSGRAFTNCTVATSFKKTGALLTSVTVSEELFPEVSCCTGLYPTIKFSKSASVENRLELFTKYCNPNSLTRPPDML